MIDPAMIGESFNADQQGIASECRGGGIRRVAIAQRTQRKNLPDTLAGRGQEIHEAVRGWTEVADAAARRQRRGMQQDACGTCKGHDSGRYIPDSLPVRASAFNSCSFLLILPDFVISSTRFDTKRAKRSCCLPCSSESRIWSRLAAKSASDGS